MAPACLIPGKGWDLAHIVQQRRPAHRQVRGDIAHHMGNVGKQIVFMVGRMLVEAQCRLQLRDDFHEHRSHIDHVLRSQLRQGCAEPGIGLCVQHGASSPESSISSTPQAIRV